MVKTSLPRSCVFVGRSTGRIDVPARSTKYKFRGILDCAMMRVLFSKFLYQQICTANKVNTNIWKQFCFWHNIITLILHNFILVYILQSTLLC